MSSIHQSLIGTAAQTPYIGESSDYQSEQRQRMQSKKQRIKWKRLGALICASMVFISAQGQRVSSTSTETKRLFTKKDGTTWDKYISYFKLDGTQSAYLPLDSTTISDPLDYSIMLWFKPQSPSDQWNTRYQYLFDFTESLECFFTGTGQLMCDSIQKLDKLQVDTSRVGNNQWTHLSLLGSQSQGSYLVLEQNDGEIVRDFRETYINLEQNTLNWRVCLGGCDTHNGFVGAFREFKVINQFMTPESASRMKNNYHFYDQKILAYYRFQENDFLKDEFRNQYAQIWRKDSMNSQNLQQITNFEIVKGKDFMPNDVCFPINQFKQFLNLSSVEIGGSEIETMTIDNRWIPQQRGWAYSASLWVKLGTDTCAASRPSEALRNCHLLLLRDSFMLYLLPTKNQIALYFFNPRPILESTSKTLFVPQNQWVNIQFGMNQFNGYDLRTYDILGRLAGMVSDNRNLLEQRVTRKDLSFFKGFRGVVKSVFVTTERQNLPIIMPAVNISRGQYFQDDRCLVHLNFEREHLQTTTNGTQQVINYCVPFGFNFTNLTILTPPTSLNQTLSSSTNSSTQTQHLPIQLKSAYHRDFSYLQTDFTRGLLSDSHHQLFDGVACDDDSMIPQWLGPGSHVTSDLNLKKDVTAVTIEYWFKVEESVRGSMLSVVDAASRREFLSIKMDDGIECGFNNSQGQKSSIKFKNNYENLENKPWIHVMCSFKADGSISGMIQADKDSYNETVESNGSNLVFGLSAGEYSVIIGNNNDKNQGLTGLKFRELRIWDHQLDQNEVSLWRYRQLDPLSSTSLLSYLRFAEGDLDFFDLVSGTHASSSADLSLVSDSELLVCPIGTFPSQDQSKCFKDPITTAVVSIYPAYRASDNQMAWRFSIEDSQLVNKLYAPEIKAQWEFEDKIIRNIASGVSNQKNFVILANAFRESAKYKIRVNITSNNGDLTFNKIQEITFVPVSCQYFLVNGRSANNFVYNYTNQQSTENITFTLNLISGKSYCNEIAFYKDINPQRLSYTMVYEEDQDQPFGTPKLVTNWDERSRQFIITLPKTEQYKIPLFKDVKFIFSIPWENKENNDIFPSTGLTFQNAMITMNFQKEGSVLIPSLVTKTPVILGDETAIFDASESYITFRAFGEQKTGLKFIWICPKSLQSVCSREKNSILRIEYQDFLEAKLPFNSSLSLTLRFEWTNRVNNTDVLEVSELTTNALWLNYTVPSFEIERPDQILLTADSNRFGILLLNNQLPDLSIHQVDWSIVPNISLRTLPLTMNRTLLTIPKGTFTQRTSYTITVTILNIAFPAVKKTQSISFVTQAPPQGGSAQVDPMVGVLGETEFTVSLFNWMSDNKPIRYQVWSSRDSGGETQQQHLTGSWLLESEPFKFKAINTNPLIVFIRDEIGEQIKLRLVLMIRPPQPREPSESQESAMVQLSRQSGIQLRKALSDSLKLESPGLKLNMMTSFLESLPIIKAQETNEPQNETQDLMANLTLSEQITIVMDLLQGYLTNQTTIEDPVILAYELKTLVNVMANIAINQTELLDSQLANQTMQIVTSILELLDRDPIKAQILNEENFNGSDFVHDMYDIMSAMIRFSFGDNKTRSNNEAEIVTGENVTQSNSSETAEGSGNETIRQNETAEYQVEVNEIVKAYKRFNRVLCSAIKAQQTIITSDIDIILDNPDLTADSYIYNTTTDEQFALVLNSTLLQDALQVLKQEPGCLQASYLKFDLFENYTEGDKNLTQLSSAISSVTYNIGNEDQEVDLKSIVTYTYSMRDGVNLTELYNAIFGVKPETNQPSNDSSFANQTTNTTAEPSNSTSDPNSTDSSDSDPSNADSTSEIPPEPTRRLLQTTTESNSEGNLDTQTNNTANSTTGDEGVTQSTNQSNATQNVTQDGEASESSSEPKEDERVKKIVCMAYSASRAMWDEGMCVTKIKLDLNQVECQCTSTDSLFQGVFLLNMKLQRPVVIEEELMKKKPFVAIAVIFSLLTVFIPVVASVLDWKDLERAHSLERSLSIQQRKIHSQVLNIQPSIWYWFLNHEQDQSKESLLAQNVQKLSFWGVISLTHPLLNMFTRYDGQRKSRFFRIMPWLAQSAAYTIIIIVLSDIFYQADALEESLENGEITESQALRIIQVGFAGMFALLPLPFIQHLVRKMYFEPNRVQSNLEVSGKGQLEKSDNQVTPKKSVPSRLPKNENLGTEEAMQGEELTIHQKMSQIKRTQNATGPSIMNRILAFITIGACVAAVVICIVILGEKELSIQYCTVASFFMGVFGSLVGPHFAYSIWQYLLYLIFYQEQAVLPQISALQTSDSIPDANCCQTLLLDSALLSHAYEQLVIRRAAFDASLGRTTSSNYQSEKSLKLKQRSDLSINQQQQSAMQTQIHGGREAIGLGEDGVSQSEVPPMGTVEKDGDLNGSPFALSAKDAMQGTPNLITRDNIDRPTTDRGGLTLFRNIQTEDHHPYEESPLEKQGDHQIGPIELEDEENQIPQTVLANQAIDIQGQPAEYIQLTSDRGRKDLTPEETQRQLVSTRLKENRNEHVVMRHPNSQSKLYISQDDIRGSVLDNMRPEAQEIMNRFYLENQLDDQPVYEDIEDGEPSKREPKKHSLIQAIGDVLNNSQSKIQMLSGSINKRSSDIGIAYNSKEPSSNIQYSPIRQSKNAGMRPKTSVNPRESYTKVDNAGATTGHPAWMEEADDEGKQTDFQVPNDEDGLEDNDAHVLDQD